MKIPAHTQWKVTVIFESGNSHDFLFTSVAGYRQDDIFAAAMSMANKGVRIQRGDNRWSFFGPHKVAAVTVTENEIEETER